VVTTSADRTARVWDPLEPAVELASVPVLGIGYAVGAVADGMVVATSRGFAYFDLMSAFRAHTG
jgi:hypothetical protein